jgi:hypothetical protein
VHELYGRAAPLAIDVATKGLIAKMGVTCPRSHLPQGYSTLKYRICSESFAFHVLVVMHAYRFLIYLLSLILCLQVEVNGMSESGTNSYT